MSKQAVNKQKTLKEHSVMELEALAYRQLVAIDQAQANLKIINEEIKLRNTHVQPQNAPESTTEGEEIADNA